MKFKRALSGTLAGAVVFTGLGMMPIVSAEDGISAAPIVNVTFDEGGTAYTLHGGTLAAAGGGNALSLNGDSQYADINGIADTLAAVSGDFTISVLFNPNNTATWTRLIDFGNGESGTYAFITPYSSTGNPRLAVTTSGNAGEQIVDCNTAVTAGEWHCITITRENGTSTFYLDGASTGTTSALTYDFSDIGTMDNYYLGKSQYAADAYYSGLIDDVKIYDSALTADEVSVLAAEASSRNNASTILENNCYVIDTHAYDVNGTEIFSIDDPAETEPVLYASDRSISDGTASFTLANAQGKDVSKLAAYAASYDENGVLTGVSAKTFTADEITSDSYPVSITYTPGTSDKLYIWNDMTPVGDEPASPVQDTVTLTANVENCTYTAGEVKAALYAVDADGNETLIDESDSVSLASAEEKAVSITTARPASDSGMEKLIMKVTVPEGDAAVEYTAGEFYVGVHSPVAAPPDSATTTDGVHDPSIVKFPGDDTYYVYSSHHLIFTSEDLINWTKYDFTNLTVQNISPVTYNFINSNYTNTTVNGTYWAPDVIYREGDDHPYWMYISVSCGLGGRNSAISLMKSDSPLFWADPNADIIDAGVVFATKENSSYITNAIDAHIYTDSNDGQQYFIWGSFWGGIQAVKLTADGLAEGVDYTSASTILSSCAAIRNTVYSQKNGVAGPEGPWMIEHGGNRYMFTSYGWLGSNYNTRIAKSSLDTSFASSKLTDANSIDMSTQHSAGSLSSPSGYKLIGSYRLGDGTYTISDSGAGYFINRGADDAHVYYGPGHNSAITAEDGRTFYVSHTRKDAIEIAATLQIRTMLWTADGWPVVSPVTYAGEIEQALPQELIAGTYDLASVGITKFAAGNSQIASSGSYINRNYDLPMLSSKVTLNDDMTMTDGSGNNIGTWAFDGDHTVTMTFTANGDTSVDAYYTAGDVMTMYALLGYDKDEAEPVVALTGVDQDHITQFAKKAVENSIKTAPATITDTTPVALTKSDSGNPALGFDTNSDLLYAGDPAATALDTDGDGVNDTVYIIAGHDTASNESYVMPEWVAYKSTDMTNWTYEGVVMKATDVSWRQNDTSAWASQMTEYNGKYYLYFCTWDKTSSGKQSIGVAVADSPTGPYTDIGAPLVRGTFTTPESSGWNDIDPTVLITTDADGTEHRYLAWGNSKYYVCELNEDMISIKDQNGDGSIVMHEDVFERQIKSAPDVFTEAPWLYERDGKFYMFYALGWREQMAYAMMDDPLGRYDYIQTLMPPTATSNTNHPSVIDFGDKTYFIYHNGSLPSGSGFRRAVCIDELTFDENGYVYPLSETSIGLTGTASTLVNNGKYIGHSGTVNPSGDGSYPQSLGVYAYDSENGYNTAWEIVDAKSVPAGENADNYVSIQSVNKPGLYLAANGSSVSLTQDYNSTFGEAMTFKTVQAINGDETMVSFESVSEPGRFLTVSNDTLMLSYGTEPNSCAFTVGTAAAKDTYEIKVADKEPDPVAEPDITQNFDDAATGTLISLTDDATPYTALDGVTLHMGTRSSDFQPNQNFAIQTGGITGNMLVLNTGKYQSASRGPRLAIYTPAIPYDCTVTASIMVKQGVSGSELRYNDSTSDETGTAISGLTTDWQELKVTITNDNDTYKRTIYLNDSVIASDYSNAFPVLWGTTANNAGQQICFDDLSITTTDAEGNTPDIPEVTLPAAAAYYTFDETLADSVSSETATLTGSTVTAEAATEAVYVDGNDGSKAISFSGSGSYGLALPTKPDDGTYTISFDALLNESTQYTPFVFIANYDGDTLKGGDTDAQWISIAPQGWQGSLANGPMIWSRNIPGGVTWGDLVPSVTGSLTTGAWHNVTVSVQNSTASVYVDKSLVGTGVIAAIIDDTTRMFVGVNAWDTPLNGAIDNLYVFNEALTAQQVALIGETE